MMLVSMLSWIKNLFKPASPWQSMDSAPKNGLWFIIRNKNDKHVVFPCFYRMHYEGKCPWILAHGTAIEKIDADGRRRQPTIWSLEFDNRTAEAYEWKPLL